MNELFKFSVSKKRVATSLADHTLLSNDAISKMNGSDKI